MVTSNKEFIIFIFTKKKCTLFFSGASALRFFKLHLPTFLSRMAGTCHCSHQSNDSYCPHKASVSPGIQRTEWKNSDPAGLRKLVDPPASRACCHSWLDQGAYWIKLLKLSNWFFRSSNFLIMGCPEEGEKEYLPLTYFVFV